MVRVSKKPLNSEQSDIVRRTIAKLVDERVATLKDISLKVLSRGETYMHNFMFRGAPRQLKAEDRIKIAERYNLSPKDMDIQDYRKDGEGFNPSLMQATLLWAFANCWSDLEKLSPLERATALTKSYRIIADEHQKDAKEIGRTVRVVMKTVQ